MQQSEAPPEVQKLLEAREAARKNKDFAQADILRKQIEKHGYELRDTSQGPQISNSL